NYTPQYKPPQQVASQFYLLRGDFDLNHKIDNGDLQAMLSALQNESSFESTHYFSAADLNALGDFNGDGVFDTADIQGEINLIVANASGGPSTSAVPEPASLVLFGLATLIIWPVARRRTRRA
ncbi:MAG: PEP-CTERM sorting domain-containing protein, partial [Candidatus Sulfotelmatobacter sp.]